MRQQQNKTRQGSAKQCKTRQSQSQYNTIPTQDKATTQQGITRQDNTKYAETRHDNT